MKIFKVRDKVINSTSNNDFTDARKDEVERYADLMVDNTISGDILPDVEETDEEFLTRNFADEDCDCF